MNYEALESTLKSIRNGAFTRVGYKTELPVKAVFKSQGFRVIKEAESTVRLGVKYRNISSVKSRGESEKEEWINNYQTIIPNKLVYNTNTEKFYVCVFPIRNHSNAKSVYTVLLNGREIMKTSNKNMVKYFVIDSYWNKGYRETYRVWAENILRIGKFSF